MQDVHPSRGVGPDCAGATRRRADDVDGEECDAYEASRHESGERPSPHIPHGASFVLMGRRSLPVNA